MHLNRLGKADRLAHQTLDPSPQRQVFPLHLLCIAFARLMLIRIEVTCVGAIIVRVFLAVG